MARGEVNKWFVKFLYFDRESVGIFRMLPSFFKIFLYRLSGAEIEDGVVIPRGTYIISSHLSIGNNCEFGKNSTFEIGNFALGKYARFEDNIAWRCRKVSIGDGFYCSEAAKVGWGGEFDNEAELAIGDSSFVGEEAMLNPSRLIKIGNNTAIGAGSKIYTHQFWQSVLEGYEARFMPVAIEDNVMIGCNCAVLPGSVIRKGSTVSANSMVAGEVRECALVGGIPAVELPSSRLYPRKLNDPDREKILQDIFNKFIAKVGTSDRGKYFYRFTFGDNDSLLHELGNKRVVILTYYPKISEALMLKQNPELTIFNCSGKTITGVQDDLSGELREFLRKRGIKFFPIGEKYKKRSFKWPVLS